MSAATTAVAVPGSDGSTGFPAPPWRLRGACAVVLAAVRAERARPFVPAGLDLVAARGWTVAGALLAAYEDGATLEYRELIVFCGLGRAGRRMGGVVSHIWVDSPASVAGGRAVWNLPKELATFTARGRPLRSFAVGAGGDEILAADLRLAPGRLPLPLPTAAFGARDGSPTWIGGRGRLARGTIGVARLRTAGPLAPLGLDGTWPVVAGTGLDLLFPAPAG